MEKTPSSKLFLQVSAGVLCLVLAVVAGCAAMRPWYKNIRAEVTSQPYARTISVTGEGKITIKPDIAVVSLSVVTQGPTVKQVTTDGNTRMTKVIDSIKALGVDAKDIRSSQYNLYANSTWDPKQAPTINGYTLTQEVTIKVRKLDNVENILQAGINSGANQVGQLQFQLDNPEMARAEARDLAFEQAKQKARDMAASAGVNLGRVVTFSESDGYTPPMYPMANFARGEVAMDAAVPAPSIQPGSQDTMMNVTVTYEIE